MFCVGYQKGYQKGKETIISIDISKYNIIDISIYIKYILCDNY